MCRPRRLGHLLLPGVGRDGAAGAAVATGVARFSLLQAGHDLGQGVCA
jgi:hypothetical protein